MTLPQVFDSFWPAHSLILWCVFILAVILGAVANKTNFCTMGAVSDWVNMGDSGRFRAWMFALAVAMLGVMALEYSGVSNFNATMPPYRGASLRWLEYLVGGLMFGIGMTLGSGCGNKTLIRIGGGNIKSIVVFFVIATCAYLMLNPPPFIDTSETLYSLLFYRWMDPLKIPMSAGYQDIGQLISHNVNGVDSAHGRLIAGAVLAAFLLLWVFRSKDFYGRFDNILGGLVVGLCVLGAWYVTSSMISIDKDGETFTWASYTAETTWSFNEDKPDARPDFTGAQSFTFINPMGQALRYAGSGLPFRYLTFGVVAVFGVIGGSLLWALLSRSFRVEWFASLKDMLTHIMGAILMGIGGVLSVGCTIGQGITGASTLSIGSFIALGGIVLGSAATMKIQYYKLVYEKEATFWKAFVTAFVDLNVFPKGWRRLEAV